ncbi:MAG: hypothetical protein V7603_2613 [Micromonosporaceae bacterium]
MTPGGGVAGRLADLRDGFDRSFSEPPRQPPGRTDLLAIRVADLGYAVRLSTITGLWADRPTTPLPGPVPDLVGLASFRGTVVPVYDLAALLGHAGHATIRWLMLATDTPPLALGFGAVDGHLQVPATAVAPVGDSGQTSRGLVSELVTTGHTVLRVIDIRAVRATVAARAGATVAGREAVQRGTA